MDTNNWNGIRREYYTFVNNVKRRIYNVDQTVFVALLTFTWDVLYHVFLYTEQASIVDSNLYVWLLTNIVLALSVTYETSMQKTNLSLRECFFAMFGLVMCHLAGHSAMSHAGFYQSSGYGIVAFIGYLFSIYMFSFTLTFNNHWGFAQIVLGGFYATVAGCCMFNDTCNEPLEFKTAVMLTLISLMYKVVWVLSARQHQIILTVRERGERLPLLHNHKQRIWHGRWINKDAIDLYLQPWSDLVYNYMLSKAQTHQSYQVHIDAFHTQHMGFAVNGVYAIRIAPTSEVEYFSNTITESRLGDLDLRDQHGIECTLVFGKNEKDSLNANRVEDKDGMLFRDAYSYWFIPEDKLINCIWSNKCRPNVVHNISVKSGVRQQKLDIPKYNGCKDELQIQIFEHQTLHDRGYPLNKTILDSQYVVVLKRVNTKVKQKKIIKRFVEIAKEDIGRRCFGSPYKQTNLKKLMVLDWCKLRELKLLRSAFLKGALKAPVVFEPDTGNTILLPNGNCIDKSQLQTHYDLIEVPNMTASASA